MKKVMSLILVIVLSLGMVTGSFANSLEIEKSTNIPIRSYIENDIFISEYETPAKSFTKYNTNFNNNLITPKSAADYYEYELIDSGWYKKGKDLGWHDDFPREKKVKHYGFSTSTISMGISIGSQYISFNVSASEPTSMTGIEADPTIWTRPKVYGDLKYYKYNVKHYTGPGRLIDEFEETKYLVDRTYIVAEPFNN